MRCKIEQNNTKEKVTKVLVLTFSCYSKQEVFYFSQTKMVLGQIILSSSLTVKSSSKDLAFLSSEWWVLHVAHCPLEFNTTRKYSWANNMVLKIGYKKYVLPIRIIKKNKKKCSYYTTNSSNTYQELYK